MDEIEKKSIIVSKFSSNSRRVLWEIPNFLIFAVAAVVVTLLFKWFKKDQDDKLKKK